MKEIILAIHIPEGLLTEEAAMDVYDWIEGIGMQCADYGITMDATIDGVTFAKVVKLASSKRTIN